jgi:hypothetical protein
MEGIMQIDFNESLYTRFWSRISQPSYDACWPWTGTDGGDGYGVIVQGRKGNIRAHRLMWLIAHGPIPNGLFVCHHCDNPSCVNLNHLFLGTVSDNAQDMVRKRRNKPMLGELHGCSKLTNEQVISIRKEYVKKSKLFNSLRLWLKQFNDSMYR